MIHMCRLVMITLILVITISDGFHLLLNLLKKSVKDPFIAFVHDLTNVLSYLNLESIWNLFLYCRCDPVFGWRIWRNDCRQGWCHHKAILISNQWSQTSCFCYTSGTVGKFKVEQHLMIISCYFINR